MTRRGLLRGKRCLRGFSLIELMVSMAIGLMIAAAAFSAYLGAASASKAAEAQGRMNEDAQAALTILTQQLRMAGGNPNQPTRTDLSRRNPVYLPYDPLTFEVLAPVTFVPSAFSLRGCDGKFSNIATATSLDDLNCAAGANALPDSVAVSYEADVFNSIPTAAKVPTDCLGVRLNKISATSIEAFPVSTDYYVANNLFYIGTAQSIASPSLYCKGNGVASTAQALVENIEDMQFTYGAVKASDAATAGVAGYLTADQVRTQVNMAGLANDAERWAKIITVRICVLVRSEVPVATDSASARYLKCDGTLETTPADLRLRRAYHAVVVLRNRRL